MAFGEILRQAREDMGLSEKEVSNRLQISVKYISSLEDGNISRLPPRVYSRGYLKKYAEFLKLPTDELLGYFDEDWPSATEDRKNETTANIFKFEWLGVLDRKAIIFSFLLAAVGVIGVYFLYQFRFAIGEPKINIYYPAKDVIVESDELAVAGKIEEGADLVLNGRPMYVNEDGEFEDSALLHKGLNVLEFEVKNRFGRVNRAFRYIVLKSK